MHIMRAFSYSHAGLAAANPSPHISSVLPDEQAMPEQIAIFKHMTPAQRWQAARSLYWTMRRHKAAFVQYQIDHSALRDWINRLGLQPQWAQVTGS